MSRQLAAAWCAAAALVTVAGCSHSVSGGATFSPDVATLKVTATTDVRLPSGDHPLELSPDGTKVAFSSGAKICVADTNGSHRVCPTDNKLAVDTTSFAWSPDGSKIAMTDDFYRLLHEPDIWVMNARTGAVKDITDDGVAKWDIGKAPAKAELDLFPSWSADSKTIRFTRQSARDRKTIDLESIPATGGTPSKLGRISLGSTVYANSVVFSADGKTVAWSTGQQFPYTAHIRGVSGGKTETLTAKKGYDYNILSFSSDGKYLLADSQIAYASYASSHPGRPLVVTVGSGVSTPVAVDASASYPSWLGGTHAIVFEQFEQKDPVHSKLRVVATPGGKSRTLLTGRFGTAEARFSSAGARLLLYKGLQPSVLTLGS